MEVVDPGHAYKLANLRYAGSTYFQFYKDPELHDGKGYEGPSTQEVLRACIDRVKHLDKERHWHGNVKIIEHLRHAIALFEMRNLERLIEKNYEIEDIPVNYKGHFV